MRQALKRSCLVALLLLGSAVAALAQSRDPDAARIVTDDIDRFWGAFDRAAPELPAQPFEAGYLAPGTTGLKDFVALRIGGAEELAKTLRAHPKYYRSIRESTQRIRTMEPGIRASFYALKYLYPDAVFPDVYFLIGRLTSGGTVSSHGLLIGAEMNGRTPQAPMEELSDWLRQVIKPVDQIPHIVAHELIHFQQKYPDAKTLLGQAIREGSADFLAELISGSHGNQHIHEFADPREAELWAEFQRKMHGKDFAGWLYSDVEGRPHDLGYWMGYKITKSYYDRAGDKRQAIREILGIQDFDAFLAKSGYAERFATPVGVNDLPDLPGRLRSGPL
ncbi:MAG TPA: DUF2268 domain-containing putative Zn-dependent protease [Thermoanaerobaculia bacterium]